MAHVLPGMAVTATVLTDTSIPEPDASVGEVVWAAPTVFAKGDLAADLTLHWVWESVSNGNTGNALPTVKGLNSDHWLSRGPTNRYAMFDQTTSKETVGPSPLVIELTPGQRVDSLAMANVVADDVVIRGFKDGLEIYNRSQALRYRTTLGWRDYFFGKFQQLRGSIRHDLPLHSDMVFTVEFTRSGGPISVRDLGIGQAIYLGKTRPNPASDALNFSEVSRPQGGDAQFAPRRSVPTVQAQIFVEKERARQLRFTRDNELNGVMAFWSALDDPTNDYFEPLFLVGFPTRWRINMAPPSLAEQDFELEER